MGSIYLLAKFLSASEYGQYTFLFSLIIFFTNAGHLGIGYSNVYYLANKEISQDVILGNSLFFCFLSGIITCLIMNLLPYIFINMFHDIDSFIVLVASLGIATCICERFLLGYFNGKEDYSKYLFVFSLSWALQAIIIGLFYLTSDLNVLNSIYAFIIARIITLLLSIFLFTNYKNIKINFDKMNFQIKYGFPMYGRDFSDSFNYRYLFILMKNYYDSSLVGNYAMALQASEVILYIPRTLSTVLFPYFTSNTLNKNKIKKILLIFIPSIFATLFLCLFLYPFIIQFLYNDKYILSIGIFKILLIGIFFISILYVFEAYILSENKQIILTISSIISALFLLVISFMIMPVESLSTLALTNSLIMFIYFLLVMCLFYKNIYNKKG